MSGIKKILFIRFSSIGDIVLTTPVVRCVKEQLGAEVHYLTKAGYASALNGNPYIDRLITIAGDINEVADQLKGYKYDWVADLHHNLRTYRLKWQLGRPGASFPKLNFEKWLMTNFKIDRLPAVHIVDRYFETVASLGVVNDHAGLDYFITGDARVEVEKLSNGVLWPGNYISIAIGAGLRTKNLEDRQWLRLVRDMPVAVALLGGNEDKARGEWLVGNSNNCFNLAGSLSLVQSASVIEQSKLLVTPDTGLMHIAAALRKPIISIWGNTVPEFGMTPYYPAGSGIKNQEFQVKDLSCRPCSKIGYTKCPRGHFRCMREQPLEDIIASSRKIIEGYPMEGARGKVE